jgi:pSer/pThr/pTyr-binding forkhead associated (FHA) protein
VSRTHAAVLRWENGWTLLDLGSRDGTTLNGRSVTDGTPLRPGDVVRCGDVVLLVADSRAGGLPEDARETGGAADLRDASALTEPILIDRIVDPIAVEQVVVEPGRAEPVVVDLAQDRRPVG